MGWQDRDYHREQPGNPFASHFANTSITTVMIVVCFVVWLVTNLTTGSMRGSGISPLQWGPFSVDAVFRGGEVWRIITYQFLHNGFLHLFFNMLGLYFFGPMIERHWGKTRFLAFYLICGSIGAFVYTLLSLVPGLIGVSSWDVLVGASGAVFGIVTGAAVLFPHQRVMLLIPPIPMSMRTMALFFLGISVLAVILGSENAGGEAAHLGGALAGFLMIKWPVLLGWVPQDWQWRGWLAKRRRIRQQQREQRMHEKDSALEAEVDRILKKVKAHGLQSLTAKEKRTLSQATDRERRAG